MATAKQRIASQISIIKRDTVVLPPKRVIFVNQFELIPNFEDETSPFLGAGLNAFFKSL